MGELAELRIVLEQLLMLKNKAYEVSDYYIDIGSAGNQLVVANLRRKGRTRLYEHFFPVIIDNKDPGRKMVDLREFSLLRPSRNC